MVADTKAEGGVSRPRRTVSLMPMLRRPEDNLVAGVTIRNIDLQDVPCLVSGIDQMHSEKGSHFGWSAERPNIEQIASNTYDIWNKARTGQCVCSVALLGKDIPIGMCDILPVASAGKGYLTVWVHRAFRGEGIGTMLLGHAMRESRGLFEQLDLYVHKDNKGAKRLYERLGFATVLDGEIDYHDMMSLKLGGATHFVE